MNFFTPAEVAKNYIATGKGKVNTTIGKMLILAVLAVLIRQLQKNQGSYKGLRIFTPECDYRVIYAVLAVSAAAILIALLVPVTVYYLQWALGILLFAEMVYYTTKLM